jgi:hypothetical protein
MFFQKVVIANTNLGVSAVFPLLRSLKFSKDSLISSQNSFVYRHRKKAKLEEEDMEASNWFSYCGVSRYCVCFRDDNVIMLRFDAVEEVRGNFIFFVDE